MKNEMMNSVVHKMMVDLDRMYDDMDERQKVQSRKAMKELFMLRGELVNAEESENA